MQVERGKNELVDGSRHSHQGYGARSSEMIREEYKCPCGNGTVIYEKYDIPGFRESDIWCTCKKYAEKNDFGRGTATEKK